MTKILLFSSWLFLFNSFLFARAEITSRLSEAILIAQKTGTTVQAIIVLKDQYDISALDKQLYENKTGSEQRAYIVITELQKHAARNQANLVNALESMPKNAVLQYRSFWIEPNGNPALSGNIRGG